MAAIVGIALDPVQAQESHGRLVGDREQETILRPGAMLMPMPVGNDEHVATAPIEARAVDDRLPVAGDDEIDFARGAALGPRVLAPANQLRAA